MDRKSKKKNGLMLSPEELKRLRDPILKKYENVGNPYYSSARIWDDGIISPLNTREILIYAFSILKNNPKADIQSPVFRM